jgi:hypothetical protein
VWAALARGELNAALPKSAVRVFLFALIAYLIVYAWYYARVPDDFQILQTTLTACTPGVLCERRPVVLSDRVLRHEDLASTLFRGLHWFRGHPLRLAEVRGREEQEGKCHVSRAAFTMLYNAEDDTVVDVAGRARVLLHRGMTLVLPPGYAYVCLDPRGCTRMELHAPSELLWMLPGRASPWAAKATEVGNA